MTDFDTIVIGSGAGGLTAALALAQAGHKTLVLEQHYLPGGWCHSFRLGGYRFSPGVHYIGELGPGGRMRAIYEGLGLADDMAFCELNPDGFDHILVAGQRFDIPRGKEAFADRLKARFPREAAGIDGYLDTCQRFGRELNDMMEIKGLLDALTLPLRARTVARWGLRSAKALINGHVKDPFLRAIFAAQAGDHGLPPSLAPAAVHAAVTGHYFNGGYYPRGGGYAIPRAFVRALKRAGGAIRMRASVERILVEDGRAIGVRLAGGEEIRARNVVSNADPDMTFRRLIGPEHLSKKLQRRLGRTKYSVSALSLFMAVDMDVRAAGLDSGNYWHYTTDDIDSVYKAGMTAWGKEVQEVPGMFLTVTTLKDPSKLERGHHTMEAFAFVDYDAFSTWSRSRYGDRPEDYKARKEDLTRLMLRGASRIVPGLMDKVVFAELGTPLTNEHYVAATRGNLYGTEKSLWQVGPWGFQVGTEIKGLKMCGASTLSHGVMGATVSGLVAAAKILHVRMEELLGRGNGSSIRIYPSESPESWAAPSRAPALERELTLDA